MCVRNLQALLRIAAGTQCAVDGHQAITDQMTVNPGVFLGQCGRQCIAIDSFRQGNCLFRRVANAALSEAGNTRTEGCNWTGFAIGAMEMPMVAQSLLLGGNVRVGLEDSLLIGKGTLATSNADQVRKIRRILEELGYEIASPDEARAMLSLKGADKVNF